MLGNTLDAPISIDPLSDADIFAVTLTAGTTVVIDTEVVSGGFPDTMISLYNAAGDQVAFNDDFGGKRESRLLYDVPATGTYYVVVS